MEFFEAAHRRGLSLFIVSHKTRFANYDETRADLREGALRWMEARGFFEQDRSGLVRPNVFFADTRAEKIARIGMLGCTVFIDDLEEVFVDPAFPGDVSRVLFTSGNAPVGSGAIIAKATWADITRHVLGEPEAAAANILDETTRIAVDLIGAPIRSIEPVRAGGNNRLFRITAVDGARFALKQYPRQASDPRDRLATEFRALQFMRQAGATQVPAPLASDPMSGFALYDWIDGQSPVANASTVEAAIAFVGELLKLSGHQTAAMMPTASEACFSPADIVAQVERRFAVLKDAAASHAHLDAFLAVRFAGTAVRTVERAKELCRGEHVDFDAPLDSSARCLSPSDFGFHNALQRPDGRLVFLDFEYFGWDDPVKLTCDFMLHPGMNLSPDLARQFRQGMVGLFGAERGFDVRLRVCLPLYALRWTMILLNEFLPERWARRVAAGVQAEHRDVLEQQLEKAKAMLARAETADSST
ncbi:phosphotransferase family protein [Bradyrhizobium sp. Bra78]|uniref:phosphotransferase family protein n=2 Tax=Nitrobacteraceae TaxID=41294 RepID=UPI0021C5856B|nr:phosphotransferase [Bradyrhizobium sp. Bra78]